jgi:hypothetical protein
MIGSTGFLKKYFLTIFIIFPCSLEQSSTYLLTGWSVSHGYVSYKQESVSLEEHEVSSQNGSFLSI